MTPEAAEAGEAPPPLSRCRAGPAAHAAADSGPTTDAWLPTLTATPPPATVPPPAPAPPPVATHPAPALQRQTARTSTPRPWPGAPPRRTASTCTRCTARVRAGIVTKGDVLAAHAGAGPRHDTTVRVADGEHAEPIKGPGGSARRLHGAQPRHPHRDVVPHRRGGRPRQPPAPAEQRARRGWQRGQGVVHPSHRVRRSHAPRREPGDDDAFRAHRRWQAGSRPRSGAPRSRGGQRPQGRDRVRSWSR